MLNTIYTDGTYLKQTGGDWHLADSPFKAEQIAKMLSLAPYVKTEKICEVGCGVGGVLAELAKKLPATTKLTGFEVSPQAHELSKHFTSSQCSFRLEDPFETMEYYDLVLILDVVEHVENAFDFMRRAQKLGKHKLYHIPLDIHANWVLRGVNNWHTVGHLHQFTAETALESLRYAGNHVLEWFFTPGAFAQQKKRPIARVANGARALLEAVSPLLSARLLGGYSLMILTE